jgi:CubicO group peptidase (beta-lactamase class C family)
MKKYLLIFLLSLLFNFSTQADHQNEPYAFNKMWKYKIDKSENHYKFDYDLQDNELSKKVEEQLKNKKTTNLVSYLLYEDGKIKIDQKTKSKYGKYYPSHSIGKSLVSVVTGYAVCEGYIDSVQSNIDYPTVKNTLYENQKLLHLLNMTAGDQSYLGEMWDGQDSKMNSNGKSINTIPIKNAMKKYFKNKIGFLPGVNFNYSAMTTNVIMNYVIYKTGVDWEKLLNKVFVEDAKVKNKVYFGKALVKAGKNKVGNRKSGEYGRYSFYAQRDDYLRIGLMVMNHWNNNTCVGKYLKTMYENRVDKDKRTRNTQSASQYSHGYGGQFHFDIVGLEDRKILSMDGFGGQQLIIDFDKKRVISVASTDRHYDWYEIVYKTLEGTQ